LIPKSDSLNDAGKLKVNKINSLATTLPYGYLLRGKSPEFVSHLALDSTQLHGYDSVILEVRLITATSRFLSYDFVDVESSTTMISNSLTDFLFGVDFTFEKHHPLFSTLRIEKAINNLYSYNLYVSKECSADKPQDFYPLVRQYTSTASEEQFRLITSDDVPAKILFHGFNSPMGAISKFRVKSLSSLDFSFRGEGPPQPSLSHGGIYLQFWLDPSCQYQVQPMVSISQ
jgi:hypothetical protein